MCAWVLLLFGVVAAVPALSQVASEASGGTSDDSQMMTPPPVSSQSYPTEVGAEVRSNYLRAGLSFATAYIDNMYAGSGNPIAETTYSLLPTIAYDQVRPRQHLSFVYSPGFTFYQPSSVLNEVDESLNASYQYRLTEHVSINAGDVFQQSSTAYAISNTVSGSPPPFTPGLVAPFTERLSNTANVQISYQFSPLGMIGASGMLSKLNYPKSSESTGLFDSDQSGGSAFYNRRLNATQYAGASYRYSKIVDHPDSGSSETQTHSISAFYTIYPMHNLSISVSGGPQYYSVNQTGVPASGSWGPLVSASMGWQGSHTSFAASYSREVTSGGGLLGAYDSNTANASAHWQMSRALIVGTSANYSINKSVTPGLNISRETGGHTISGSATAGYTITQRISAQFEYDRVHESYSGIPAISPNSDREMISLNWQFTRPLGR
jgi:hypothetical protein